LTFFFKNINKAYSAKFVLYDEETRTYSYVPFADGSSSIPSVQKVTQEEFASGITRFKESPFIAYQPKKDHYDFQGWSVNASGTPVITSTEEWNSVNSTLITEDVYDYIYYACFIKHSYNIYFYNNNDPSYGSTVDENGNKCEKLTVTYGENLSDNVLMPQAIDATELEMRNTFKGWTLNRDSGRVYN